ncbi:hypothetical protein D3C84_575910 [compost metagenome]
MGQGAVVRPVDLLAVAFEGDGVVGGHFGAETDSACSEACAVVEYGALDPVVAAAGGHAGAVAIAVVPQRAAFGALAGVPVAG